eukprot:7133130-Heterocapsa_arctica.AAC.1
MHTGSVSEGGPATVRMRIVFLDSGSKRKLHSYLEANKNVVYYRDGSWPSHPVRGRWVESQLATDRRTHINI